MNWHLERIPNKLRWNQDEISKISPHKGWGIDYQREQFRLSPKGFKTGTISDDLKITIIMEKDEVMLQSDC